MFYKNSDVFNGVVNSVGYKVGDGKFSVFGHGAPGYLIDLNSNTSIHNAKEFDQMMSILNSIWNAAKDKNGTVLSLWSCESATPDKYGYSLAQMISAAHPNILVTGADGFVSYGQTWYGSYQIMGINCQLGSGKNDGSLVGYRNGAEVYRAPY